MELINVLVDTVCANDYMPHLLFTDILFGCCFHVGDGSWPTQDFLLSASSWFYSSGTDPIVYSGTVRLISSADHNTNDIMVHVSFRIYLKSN